MAALAVGLLGGCTAVAAAHTDAPPAPQAPSPISDQQVQALADGAVNRDEYEAAFAAFASCMGDAGYDVTLDPDGGDVIMYHYLATAEDEGISTPCYEQDFQSVDMTWQLDHESTSLTSTLLRECLERKGIAAAEDPRDIHQQFVDNGMDEVDCLDSTVP